MKNTAKSNAWKNWPRWQSTFRCGAQRIMASYFIFVFV